MNLHAIAGPLVSAVNPTLPVTVQISTGPSGPDAGGVRTPTFATPGAFTGSIGGANTDVLTVTTVSQGTLQVGQTVLGVGVTPGTTISGLLSGSGGPGTYQLNKAQAAPVGSEAMTATLILNGQVQPIGWRDLQQTDGINMNGTRKAIYLTGAVDGLVRVTNKGGDLITFPDGSVWLVVMILEGWDPTAGWTKAAIVLQDGS